MDVEKLPVVYIFLLVLVQKIVEEHELRGLQLRGGNSPDDRFNELLVEGPDVEPPGDEPPTTDMLRDLQGCFEVELGFQLPEQVEAKILQELAGALLKEKQEDCSYLLVGELLEILDADEFEPNQVSLGEAEPVILEQDENPEQIHDSLRSENLEVGILNQLVERFLEHFLDYLRAQIQLPVHLENVEGENYVEGVHASEALPPEPIENLEGYLLLEESLELK